MSEFHEPWNSTPYEKWPELEARFKAISLEIRQTSDPDKKKALEAKLPPLYERSMPLRTPRLDDDSI